MTSKSKKKNLPWNRDTPASNGKPAQGFTINTGIIDTCTGHRTIKKQKGKEYADIQTKSKNIGKRWQSVRFL